MLLNSICYFLFVVLQNFHYLNLQRLHQFVFPHRRLLHLGQKGPCNEGIYYAKPYIHLLFGMPFSVHNAMF